MWDLVPITKIEPRPPALGAWSLNHWTTREVPIISALKTVSSFCYVIKFKSSQQLGTDSTVRLLGFNSWLSFGLAA